MAHEKAYGNPGKKYGKKYRNKKSSSGDMSYSDMSYSGGDMKGSTSEKSYYRPMDSYSGPHKDEY